MEAQGEGGRAIEGEHSTLLRRKSLPGALVQTRKISNVYVSCLLLPFPPIPMQEIPQSRQLM